MAAGLISDLIGTSVPFSLATYTLATLPAASAANAGYAVRVSNLGQNGTTLRSNGTSWLPDNDSLLIANREGLTLSKTAAYTLQIAAGRSVTANATGDRRVSVLAAAISKTINVAWAVGTGNGGLDTGAISNTTYHIYLIERPDTGAVDVIASTSATSPTLPTNYTYYRRIGAVVVQSAAIRDFDQYGNLFKWRDVARGLDGYSVATSGELKALTVPLGIRVEVQAKISPGSPVVSGQLSILVSDPSQTDVVPISDPRLSTFNATAGAINGSAYDFVTVTEFTRVTNDSGQLRFRRTGTYFSAAYQTTVETLGYVDLDLGILSGSSSSSTSSSAVTSGKVLAIARRFHTP